MCTEFEAICIILIGKMLVYGSRESVFQQNESYDSDYSLEI